MRSIALAASIFLAASCLSCISVGGAMDEITKKECREREKLGGSSKAKAFLDCQNLTLRGWIVIVW